MCYKFDKSDPTVEAAVRRIALGQLSSGIAALDRAGDEDLHAGVHDARKRVKKVRGLLRLVRGGFPDYAAENRYLRDAARLLSDFRDRTAVLETFDRLADRHGKALDMRRVAPLRRHLEECRAAAAEAPELADRIAAFRDSLRAVHGKVPEWRLDRDGWAAIGPGVKKTYARARKAMAAAGRSRDAAELHDWRKRVKYHWYHARLLEPIWADGMTGQKQGADALSDMLGERHDLDALGPHLAQGDLSAQGRQSLERVIAREKKRLEARAFTLGARLLADPPKVLVKRWAIWWDLRPQAA